MNRLIAVILFFAFPAAAQIVVSGGGVIASSNPNQIVGGSITNAYTFNGPFNTVNVTNVYMAAVISNLVMTGIATNATNASASVHSSGGKGTNTTLRDAFLVGDHQFGNGDGSGSLIVSNGTWFYETTRLLGSTVLSSGIDANSVLYKTVGQTLAGSSAVNLTELEYLDGVTSPIQAQLNVRNSIYTNGVLVTGMATQLNFVSASGIRVGASQSSGVVTITPSVTNIWGTAYTNAAENNISHTNSFKLGIPYEVTSGLTHNTDGFTVLVPGLYSVHCRANYGLNINDALGVAITTNNVDFTPSIVHSYYDKASGGAITQTNFIQTSAMIRLVENDRLRFKRWSNTADGKVFFQETTIMTIHRLGD